MNRFVRRTMMVALLAGTSLSVSAPALAQDPYGAPTPSTGGLIGEREAPRQQAQPQEGEWEISRAVGRPLVEGQEAYNAMDYAGALEAAREADAIEEKNPLEIYHIAKLLGVVAVAQMNLAEATVQFNRAIESGAMPPAEALPTLRTSLLLNYNAQDYARAVDMGGRLLAMGPLDEQSSLVLTQSYYLTDDYAGAVRIGQQLIESGRAAGTAPGRDLLAVIMNSQIRMGDQAAARGTLEQLTLVEPTPDNWARVIDGAFTTPNLSDHQLLNLYRLRVQTNSMTETDYLGMASAALQLGLPNEAKDMLNKGIADGVLTQAAASDLATQANTLSTSDQAALPELEGLAAAATNGELDVKLGESYWTYGRDADAEAAIRRGIQKGGLSDTADAQITLGVVLLDQGKTQEAAQAFQQADQAGGGQVSHVWSLYAQSRTATAAAPAAAPAAAEAPPG